MRMLVCGGRDFKDIEYVNKCLDSIHHLTPITEVIQGGANGADTCAAIWASSKNIKSHCIRAEWSKYGKMAGAIRNAKMLKLKPDLVVAFPGGRGTADMIEKTKSAKIILVTFDGTNI